MQYSLALIISSLVTVCGAAFAYLITKNIYLKKVLKNDKIIILLPLMLITFFASMEVFRIFSDEGSAIPPTIFWFTVTLLAYFFSEKRDQS